MFIIEYSICSRTDGIEEWEDKKIFASGLGELAAIKVNIREQNKGSLIVFGDIYKERNDD